MTPIVLRLLICAAFLVSGVLKALNFNTAQAEVAGLTGITGLAAPLAVLVILTQLGGSALLLAGGRLAVAGGVLLAVFTAAATLLAHAFWTKTGIEAARDVNTFFEHVGLIGGLLLVAWFEAKPRRTPA
jgi:transmembrane protein